MTNQAEIDQLNALGKTLATAQATQPDLTTFLNDDQGRYKLNAAFVIQTLPDTPSTGPCRRTVRVRTRIWPSCRKAVPVSGTPRRSATFQDWNKNKVSITTGAATSPRQSPAGRTTRRPISITPTIHYLDWDGNQMTASRRGAKFLVLRNGSANRRALPIQSRDCPHSLRNPVPAM